MKTLTNKQNTTSFQHLSSIIVLCIVAILMPKQADAKNCRKVHLEVRNQTGGNVKILDLDYYDTESEKWRSEPVKNTVIRNNRSWQETRTLEHVYNQNVKVRAEYKVRKWSRLLNKNVWSKKMTKNSSWKTCRKYSDYVVTIR